MKVADIMTPKVIAISPEQGAKHAACVMLENHISGLPVLDDNGSLGGTLSEVDLLRHAELGPAASRDTGSTHEEALEIFIKGNSWGVGVVKTPGVVTVHEDTPVDRIAAVIQTHYIKRVPVARAGQMAGIVSRGDILRVTADALSWRSFVPISG
ncbi:CBS domain-containing protein [Sinorhizobium medicae]|uniref:CBS domain-containing protein n=1 Tax=Sinorhizobium medicae TaxID=110321 RepID=UPI00040403ED|nr:CBS domain-containing protein [Sinorhizobium medicae]